MTRHALYQSVIFLLLCTGPLFARELPDTAIFLSNRTAFTVPRGQFESGLIQPMRFGLSNRVELSAHPILIFADPQVMVKVRWKQTGCILISSEHRIACPTPLMRLFTTAGAGGLISPQFTIPVMASVYNGIITTGEFADKSLITAKAGIIFALGAGKLDQLSRIDLPVIYPREAVFYHQPVIDLALDYRCPVPGKLECLLASEYFIIPGTHDNFFFEHRLNLLWKPGAHILLQGGYRLCYGLYPFGKQWHLLPDIDIAFHFGRNFGATKDHP